MHLTKHQIITYMLETDEEGKYVKQRLDELIASFIKTQLPLNIFYLIGE